MSVPAEFSRGMNSVQTRQSAYGDTYSSSLEGCFRYSFRHRHNLHRVNHFMYWIPNLVTGAWQRISPEYIRRQGDRTAYDTYDNPGRIRASRIAIFSGMRKILETNFSAASWMSRPSVLMQWRVRFFTKGEAVERWCSGDRQLYAHFSAPLEDGLVSTIFEGVRYYAL